MMKQYGFSDAEIQELFKCLDANSHNHMTTTYYLFYKQLKKQGKLKCQFEKVKQESGGKEFSKQRKKQYEKAVLDSITKIRNSSQKPFGHSPNKEKIQNEPLPAVNKSVDIPLNQTFSRDQNNHEYLPTLIDNNLKDGENSHTTPKSGSANRQMNQLSEDCEYDNTLVTRELIDLHNKASKESSLTKKVLKNKEPPNLADEYSE